MRRSLSSPRQSVWVVGLPAGHPAGPGLAALLVLWHHATSLRVYDVATHPALRGQGLGTRLMGHARRLAQEAGCGRITLEADPKEPGLVSWYQEKGFEVIQRLPAFYRGGRPAVRMALRLRPAP